MGDIDRVGAFRGTIEEAGIGQSSGGFPQFTLRMKATQKWVDDPAEFEAFSLTEAGWADWSAYDQYITGYLILMHNDKKNPGAMKASFHIEALQEAVGWSGASFAALNDPKNVGKTITFWVEENEYQGNTRLQLQAVGAADASALRALKTLDSKGIADLDAKFAGILAGTVKPGKAATPAKAPAKAPTPTAPGKPASPAAKPIPATSSPAPISPSPSKSPPSKGPPVKAAAPVAASTSCTKDDAWAAVMKGRGTKSDDDVGSAWLAASDAIAAEVAESDVTDEQWAQIRDHALAALK